jgi:hypothetical protein
MDTKARIRHGGDDLLLASLAQARRRFKTSWNEVLGDAGKVAALPTRIYGANGR